MQWLTEATLRLITPGSYVDCLAFKVFWFFVMVVILVSDLNMSSELMMHTLYVFPLCAMALHTDRRETVVVFTAAAIALQVFDCHADGMEGLVLIANSLLATATSTMIVFLSRLFYKNYRANSDLAATDYLTGLANRRNFDLMVTSEIARQERYGGIFSVALLDLDNFKTLNDSLGHHVGDNALKLTAKMLKQHTRRSDLVARIGGDEFAILMPSTNVRDCTTFCKQLAGIIADRMKEASFGVTVSVGCSTFTKAKTVVDIMHVVDSAMYQAKAEGKNRAIHMNDIKHDNPNPQLGIV